MIKGKAKLEFGTGDIRMTGALSNNIGALCCITQPPHKIGEKVPVEENGSGSGRSYSDIFKDRELLSSYSGTTGCKSNDERNLPRLKREEQRTESGF